MDYRRRRAEKTPPRELPREEQIRQAKLKALRLLERMDRTEAQLREKLMQAEFEPEATEQAVAYVKSFGYVNDERYVRNYIECRREQKSRRQIEQELLYKKGVPKDLIRQVYEELEPADERELIRRFLEKKHYCGASADEKKKRSVMASLARKGFSAEDILAVMREEQ